MLTFRFGKRLSGVQKPWLPDSEFARIVQDLDAWSATLPAVLQFHPNQVYIRKSKSQLSAFIFLHTAYHLCYLDLFRLAIPSIQIPGAAQLWTGDEQNYRAVCLRILFEHANVITSILEEALKHGTEGLLDSMIGLMAHEAARYQIFYTSVDSSSDTMDVVFRNVHIDARTLTRLRALGSKVDLMVYPNSQTGLTGSETRWQNYFEKGGLTLRFSVQIQMICRVTQGLTLPPQRL
jgi:hypothetical protein